MRQLTISSAGRFTAMSPAPRQDGKDVWVPLEAFCQAMGVTLKDIGDGQLAVCNNDGADLCIPLASGDTRPFDTIIFGRLEAFGEPLGLSWQTTGDGVLSIARGPGDSVGLGFGDQPPRIELPDVHTGRLVSSDVYYDKPAVFYMWASW